MSRHLVLQPRTGNTAISPCYWTSPTQPGKRRYTCEEVALTTMDQLPLPRRRTSANTTLVLDMCSSMSAATTNLPLSRWKAFDASEE